MPTNKLHILNSFVRIGVPGEISIFVTIAASIFSRSTKSKELRRVGVSPRRRKRQIRRVQTIVRTELSSYGNKNQTFSRNPVFVNRHPLPGVFPTMLGEPLHVLTHVSHLDRWLYEAPPFPLGHRLFVKQDVLDLQRNARTSTGTRQATTALRPQASASSMSAHWRIQKPPMCSLASR